MMPATVWKHGARGSAIALICLATVMAAAQTEHRFTFEVGGGFAPFVGGYANRLGPGWHGDVGAGWNLTKVFSLGAKYSYNAGFDVSREVLINTFAPVASAASMHVWSLTADPRLQLGVHKHLAPYLVGGVGYYHRTLDFTPTAVFIPPFNVRPTPSGTDKYLGVLGNSGHGDVGGNLGGGLSFPLRLGLSVFAEARYHYTHAGGLGAVAIQMVPVTFGDSLLSSSRPTVSNS